MRAATQDGLILAIESSCDETAAAVVRGGREVLSNVVATQIAMHAEYGGVVPELASREHLRNIVPVVHAALAGAGVAFKDIDAVAVTEGPGLAGALLVGIMYAKALAFALDKPLIAVNHLEGHIHAVLMQAAQPAPVLALVVSGGHTHLYLATEHDGVWSYRNVGRTLDDAAGEAYDKAGKLLGLGYPAGPWMDWLAAHGDARAVKFNIGNVKAAGENAFPFSFSGIKTAVLRHVEGHGMQASIDARRNALAEIAGATAKNALPLCDAETLGLIASFQYTVVRYLAKQTFAAAEAFGAASIVVSGGVSANRELRAYMTAQAAERGLPIAFPAISLATDNAAMIAAAAWPKLRHGDFAPATMNAVPQLRLGERRNVPAVG